MTYAGPRFSIHAENRFKNSCVGLDFANGEAFGIFLSRSGLVGLKRVSVHPDILDLFDQSRYMEAGIGDKEDFLRYLNQFCVAI